ncbi:hypothetical protein ABW21_db0205745 [Orbilia brochopaga]|nr:hypothetical protein ABW21_db0205745 [Drechslerella brochopaga]
MAFRSPRYLCFAAAGRLGSLARTASYMPQLTNFIPRKFVQTKASSPSPTPLSPVGHMFLNGLKKADIGVTKSGRQEIILAFDSVLPSELEKPSIEIQTLWRLEDLLDEAYREFVDYKVHKMWEALYSKSDFFRTMIDVDEENVRYNTDFVLRPCSVRDGSLWGLLSAMLQEGVFERADIDNLPEPFKLCDLPPPSAEEEETYYSNPRALRCH